MYLNKTKLREILESKAGGNYHKMARMLKVDVAQLHRVLNSKSNPGPKFLGKLFKFCENNELNFNDFIFFDEPLHLCNNSKNKKKSVSIVKGNS